MARNRWTAEEDDLLKEHYRSKGSAEPVQSLLRARGFSRSICSIHARAYRLNLHPSGVRRAEFLEYHKTETWKPEIAAVKDQMSFRERVRILRGLEVSIKETTADLEKFTARFLQLADEIEIEVQSRG